MGKIFMSVEDLAKLADDDMFHELDEGELITRPPGSLEHGDVGAQVMALLGNFVKPHSLGRAYGANTGFRLHADTVRAPDAAFVRKERLGPRNRQAFFDGAPDLAVEVFSPSDSVPQLMRKVRQYLTAGGHTVWVVYPEARQVHVFEAAGKDPILGADDSLEAPELLPGFSVLISELFE